MALFRCSGCSAAGPYKPLALLGALVPRCPAPGSIRQVLGRFWAQRLCEHQETFDAHAIAKPPGDVSQAVLGVVVGHAARQHRRRDRWWPFITIYLREQFDVPCTQITLLFTLYAGAGLLATSFVGPAVDRFGRRRAMIAGLAIPGLSLGAMGIIHALGPWAIALMITGMFNPMYRVGADAMVVDLVPPDKRVNAYAILRMGNNVGVAIGPAIGGFVAAVSYSLAYFSAGAANLVFALLVFFLVRETMQRTGDAGRSSEATGYGPVLRDTGGSRPHHHGAGHDPVSPGVDADAGIRQGAFRSPGVAVRFHHVRERSDGRAFPGDRHALESRHPNLRMLALGAWLSMRSASAVSHWARASGPS